MPHFPETRDSLIAQVQDPANREAWEQFSEIYRPVIYRLARRRGLQDADADDLAQQVLVAISRAIPRWRRQSPQTRFRHWLQRISRNAILNALTRAPRDLASGGSAALDRLAEAPQPDRDLENGIELEHRRQVYRRAAEMVRDSVREQTWQAFVLSVVQGVPVKTVAEQMETTIGNVHAARSRIMRRLQTAVRELLEDDE